MKTTLTRILLVALAALMLLTAASCRKNPDKDPGYILNPSADKPENEITRFLEGNEGALEALAKHMMKNPTYLAYNYSNRMVDYDKGTMEFYVQKQDKTGGAWAECKDESALRLVKVKFTGSVIYNPAYSRTRWSSFPAWRPPTRPCLWCTARVMQARPPWRRASTTRAIP